MLPHSGTQITRKALAMYSVNLFGYIYDDNIKIFSDVEMWDHYFSYINTAAKMGLMEGFSDTTFRPDEFVTVQQATKVLITALGYKVVAENQGGYPIGYIVQAQRLGILKGIDLKTDNFIDMTVLARMLFNSLEVDIMTSINYNNRIEYEVRKGDTIMSRYLHIEKAEGVIDVVGTKTLSGFKAPEGYIMIGGKQLKEGKEKMEGYFGINVKVYWKTDEVTGEDNILSVLPSKNKNHYITMLADDIISCSDNRLKYA